MKISKIGIELEGEFFTYPGERIEDSGVGVWHVKEDGSLSEQNGGYCYELVSEPLEYAELRTACKELEKLEENGRIAYANASAGTHIHVSLTSEGDYDLIRSYDFYKAFMKAYHERFTLAKYRTRTSNRYCEEITRASDFIKTTNAQATASSRSDVRYRAVNFCKKYHGTVEFRIFPYVVTIEGLLEIVDFVYSVISDYKANPTDGELLEQWKKNDFLVIPEKRNITYELWKEIIGNYTSDYQLQADSIQVSKAAISIDLLKMLAKTTVVKFENDK